jgi:SAM-dependent methyltransferase
MDHDSWKDHALWSIIRAYDRPSVRLSNRLRLFNYRRYMLDEIAQYLPPSGEVHDLGCGYGLFSIYFAMALPGVRMRGFDILPRRIASAKEAVRRLALPDVEFEVGDARSPRPSGSIRGATMIDLLRHIPGPAVQRVIEPVAASLEPGCRLIISDTRPPRDLRTLLERVKCSVYQHRLGGLLPRAHALYVAVRQ